MDKEQSPDAKLLGSGDSFLDNRKAKWIKYSRSYSVPTGTVEVTLLQYFAIENGNLYFITAGAPAKTFPIYEDLLKRSLSTFVFENKSDEWGYWKLVGAGI